MSDIDQRTLEELVERGQLSDAEAYCQARDPAGRGHWGLQRALVCFLNEMDDDIGFFDRGPALLEAYLEANPGDNDAHFWHAYWSVISRGWSEPADRELLMILLDDPGHAYSNLTIASYRTDEGARFYLGRTLDAQPGNIRALQDLARVEAAVGNKEKSAAILGRLMRVEPFVEIRLGIMNRYANEILTGAAIREKICSQARMEIERLRA
jgi:hypothetical protein